MIEARYRTPDSFFAVHGHAMALQVEFYFSDSNLPKDKFLRQQVEAHPEGCE